MSDRPNRNEQRRARALAAQEDISYQQALTRLRHDTADRQSQVGDLAALQPGEVRTVIVAWRLDDPAVQEDGRFWMVVPEQAAGALGKPAGAIVPTGQTLAWLRARASGQEVELPNPITRDRERLSLERWSHADPERTHVIVSFDHAAPPPAGGPDRDQATTARGRGSVRTPIKLELSDEAERIRARQVELQREFRAARDRRDDRRMHQLTPRLESIAAELARAAFPHYARGWDLSRAIRESTNRFVLDWTTGY